MVDSSVRNVNYLQLRNVLSRLNNLDNYYNKNELKEKLETLEDSLKLCGHLTIALKKDLSLEELSSLYTVTVMLLLLGDLELLSVRLELLNECFNYADMLKPTMIDFVTRELLDNFKFAARLEENNKDYDYMLYLLTALPHMITASETGKMISLGLLRAFISELSNPESDIIMHIYRNISEIWQMIKPLKVDVIVFEWSLCKIYTLVKSFGLILATAALNTNNAALKQAGYRGFELPQVETQIEISEWFKTLRNKMNDKNKTEKTKSIFMLVRFIDFNILSSLAEAANEVASETGNDPPAS
ncbi:uncharacterized protein LOC133839103 [Drosophila sulfurigaster albostrigata]|uniref:uncharacterized protein LOC133839103 n=1 Tax=Drosophila sulfurigaster albostrigata TaxID=89887 RepID=UPI002D21A79F|nr:uncharacterized protein LOC133839103 [Drosophila sulfurigaster albostrigata]